MNKQSSKSFLLRKEDFLSSWYQYCDIVLKIKKGKISKVCDVENSEKLQNIANFLSDQLLILFQSDSQNKAKLQIGGQFLGYQGVRYYEVLLCFNITLILIKLTVSQVQSDHNNDIGFCRHQFIFGKTQNEAFQNFI